MLELDKVIKYATIWLNMSKFAITERVLNMHHTIHSARSLYKLLQVLTKRFKFRISSKIKDGLLWKK